MKHSTSPPVSHSDIGGVPHRARGLKYTQAIHTNYNEPYQEQIKKTPPAQNALYRGILQAASADFLLNNICLSAAGNLLVF